MRELFHGIVELKKEDDWFIPVRFSDKQLEVFALQKPTKIRSLAPAGVRLIFNTKASYLEFSYRIGERARDWAYIDVWEDGMLTTSLSLEEETGSVRIPLAGEEQVRTEVFLPHLVEFAIKDIKADAPLFPVKEREKFWLCLGDSITQGMVAKHPSITYPTLAAEFMKCDVLNMGVGGTMFCEEQLDRIQREPNLITIALGCNDWGGVKDAEELRVHVRKYLERLTSLYACKQVYGILPIWRSDRETAHSGMTFGELKQLLVEEYRRYPFIRIIDGRKLVPGMAEFFGDPGEKLFHPNEKGFLYYAMKLAEELIAGDFA